MLGGDNDEKIDLLFDSFDKDGNEQMNLQEFTDMIKILSGLSDDRCQVRQSLMADEPCKSIYDNAFSIYCNGYI